MDTLFTNERNQSDDYYAILGCDELSSVCIVLHIMLCCFPYGLLSFLFFQKDQIQTEYRIRALQFHPDKNRDDPQASKSILLINYSSINSFFQWNDSNNFKKQKKFFVMIHNVKPMIIGEIVMSQCHGKHGIQSLNEVNRQDISKESHTCSFFHI